jgi:hypothetical protein
MGEDNAVYFALGLAAGAALLLILVRAAGLRF